MTGWRGVQCVWLEYYVYLGHCTIYFNPHQHKCTIIWNWKKTKNDENV